MYAQEDTRWIGQELVDEFECAKLRTFLEETGSLNLAIASATSHYDQVMKYRREIEELQGQIALATIRGCEAEINAVRGHQNAWAILLLCAKSGVQVVGFESLTTAHCKAQISQLDAKATAIFQKARVSAQRIGCDIRTGIDQGRVFIRLDGQAELRGMQGGNGLGNG